MSQLRRLFPAALMMALSALCGCTAHDPSPWDDPYATSHPHLNPGEKHLGEKLPKAREPLTWEDYYGDRPAGTQPGAATGMSR